LSKTSNTKLKRLNGDLSGKVGEGHFPRGEVDKVTRESRAEHSHKHFFLLVNARAEA
jgi:hypothetical protein